MKKIVVIDHAGERAVKSIHDTVMQSYNDIKLQKMLVVMSKAWSWTMAAYKAAVDQLTLEEQV